MTSLNCSGVMKSAIFYLCAFSFAASNVRHICVCECQKGVSFDANYLLSVKGNEQLAFVLI